MYYVLKPNVYLVKGYKNGCIYDFNSGQLYSINQNVITSLDKIENINVTENNKYLVNSHIDKLLKLNLLTVSTKKQINDINDLTSDNAIDFVWIELTQQCNLKCIHCYEEAKCCPVKTMHDKVFFKTIDYLVSNNIKRVQLIGGEPLMIGQKIYEFLDYMKGKFEFIEVFTNGTLITDEFLDYCKKFNIHLALSVYSYDSNEHDKITQIKGSHELTIKSVNKIIEKQIPYRIGNVLMNGLAIGKKEPDDKYVLSTKKSKVVRCVGRAGLKLLNEDLLKKKLITKETFSHGLNLKLTKQLIAGHNCFGHRLYIDMDGTVYPCVMERRFSLGNILTDNPIQYLQKKIVNVNEIKGCKDCEFRYTCFDCRPDSLTDDIYAKPYYCTYDPYQGTWADKQKFVDKLLKEEN